MPATNSRRSCWSLRRSMRRSKSHYCGCAIARSEEHTSELQSQSNLVCRLLLEKKKKTFIFDNILHFTFDPATTLIARPPSVHESMLGTSIHKYSDILSHNDTQLLSESVLL